MTILLERPQANSILESSGVKVKCQQRVEDLYLAGRCRADEDPLAGAIERLAVGLGRGRDGFDDVEIQV